MSHAVSQDNSDRDHVPLAVEVVELVVTPAVVTNHDTEGPIVFQSSKSIEELITNGPTDGNVEEEVRLDIT